MFRNVAVACSILLSRYHKPAAGRRQKIVRHISATMIEEAVSKAAGPWPWLETAAPVIAPRYWGPLRSWWLRPPPCVARIPLANDEDWSVSSTAVSSARRRGQSFTTLSESKQTLTFWKQKQPNGTYWWRNGSMWKTSLFRVSSLRQCTCGCRQWQLGDPRLVDVPILVSAALWAEQLVRLPPRLVRHALWPRANYLCKKETKNHAFWFLVPQMAVRFLNLFLKLRGFFLHISACDSLMLVLKCFMNTNSHRSQLFWKTQFNLDRVFIQKIDTINFNYPAIISLPKEVSCE